MYIIKVTKQLPSKICLNLNQPKGVGHQRRKISRTSEPRDSSTVSMTLSLCKCKNVRSASTNINEAEKIPEPAILLIHTTEKRTIFLFKEQLPSTS